MRRTLERSYAAPMAACRAACSPRAHREEADRWPRLKTRQTARGPGAAGGAGALALVVVASILVFPAILATWVNRQVLNTDNWTTTSTELLQNKLIRDQLTVFLVAKLYENVDVEAQVREALPPRVKPLAGPAANGLQDLAESTVRKLLARPQAQERWADANRAAHVALLRILEGGGPRVSTEGGVVTLDLRLLLEQVAARVGVGDRLAQALPAGAAEVTILRSDQLGAAQTGLKVLRGLPIVLVALSLLLFGAALLLAPDWRRQALRAYGFGLLLAGLAVLVAQSIGGDQLVSALATTAAVRPAIAAAWTIATPLLSEAANAVIFYGLAMIAGAWFAGRTRPAVAARRAIAPYARSLAVTYGAFAVVVGLILWWGPTPATRNPLLALILIVLTAGGIEALRRQIVREYPEAERSDTMRWAPRRCRPQRELGAQRRLVRPRGRRRRRRARDRPAGAARGGGARRRHRLRRQDRSAGAARAAAGRRRARRGRVRRAETADPRRGAGRGGGRRAARRRGRGGHGLIANPARGARRAVDHTLRRARAAGPTGFIPSG